MFIPCLEPQRFLQEGSPEVCRCAIPHPTGIDVTNKRVRGHLRQSPLLFFSWAEDISAELNTEVLTFLWCKCGFTTLLVRHFSRKSTSFKNFSLGTIWNHEETVRMCFYPISVQNLATLEDYHKACRKQLLSASLCLRCCIRTARACTILW